MIDGVMLRSECLGECVIPTGLHRRQGRRSEANRQAKLHFGGETVLARILDLSAGGARLRCATSEWLPPILQVADAKGRLYRAALVWQGENEIGVRWLDEGPQLSIENSELTNTPSFGRRKRT